MAQHKKILKDQIDFRSILHREGYKVTPARLAVLKSLERSRQPLSPQAIIDRVPKTIDQATVYRTLKSLKAASVVKQIDFRHSHAHYELAHKKDHHHLVCTMCGMVEDVEGCEIESMEKSVLRKSKEFHEIQQHSLEFFGLCNKCRKSK